MPNPAATEALAILDRILVGAAPPVVTQELPPTFTGPIGELETIPGYYPPDNSVFGSAGLSIFKCVLAFRSKSGNTWTETYYNNTAGSANAAAALFVSGTLINARLAFLAPTNTIYGVSASDIAFNRVAAKRQIILPGAAVPTSGLAADLAGATVVAKWFGDLPGTRVSYLRGLLDEAVTVSATTGEPQISGVTLTAIQAWSAQLRSNGCGWVPRVKINPATASTRYNAILTVNGTTVPGKSTVTCQNASLVTAGDVVTISKCDRKTLPGINGTWTVLAGAGNTFDIQYQTANNLTFTSGGGRMRIYQAAPFNLFYAVTYTNVISRRTANAFTRSRRGQSARGLRTLA